MDQSVVGTSGEPFQLFVETGKIREFAKATFSDSPLFESGECSPPTFLTTAFHWQTKQSDVLPAVAEARGHNGPYLINFLVEKEDSVYPMIPAGSALHEMIRRPNQNPLVETAADK